MSDYHDFAIGLNSAWWTRIKDPGVLERALHSLPAKFSSVTLWRIPQEVIEAKLTLSADQMSGFLQCVGESHRTTLELRKVEDDAKSRHYVVGRQDADDIGLKTDIREVVRWGDYDAYVAPGEVFDFDSALRALQDYIEHDATLPGYPLRVLDLSAQGNTERRQSKP